MTVVGVLPAALTPDDDEARRWLTEELSKAPYVESKPGPMEIFWRAVLDWIVNAFDGARSLDSELGVVLLGLAALVVIGLTVWFVRPRLNAAARQQGEIFAGTEVLEAVQHRRLGAAAARSGRYDDALTETLRAVIRSAEERTLIDPAPGRTAVEASQLVGARFPDHFPEMQWLAARFNEVRYGGGHASQEDYERARVVDQRLEKAVPVQRGHLAPGLAVPS